MSPRHRAGFTLVELLVALAILGLLLTAAFGSLRIGARSWEASADRAGRSHEIRSSTDFLRRQFAHLTPLSRSRGVDRKRIIAFLGDRRTVQFVAPAPEAAGSAGLVVVTVSIERDAAATNVWLGIAPLDPGTDQWFNDGPVRRSLLLTKLEDAELTYLGAPEEEDDIEWRAEWQQDAVRFPEAVRLSTVSRDGEVVWPAFYFRIRTEQPL